MLMYEPLSVCGSAEHAYGSREKSGVEIALRWQVDRCLAKLQKGIGWFGLEG